MNPLSAMIKAAIKRKDENAALRAAKSGAKAKAKSAFKFEVADVKNAKSQGDIDIDRKTARGVISEERNKFREAKKEIKKYKDY